MVVVVVVVMMVVVETALISKSSRERLSACSRFDLPGRGCCCLSGLFFLDSFN